MKSAGIRIREPRNLASFLGNTHVVDILRRAVGRDRLPHAMIFAGAHGVGKCTLAVLLAQQLNCLSPAGENACGSCSACRRTLSVLQSRQLTCLARKGDIDCGGCDSCRIRSNQHPDVRILQPEKTVISIDQVREMIAEIAYQPFEARYRVVILDPADEMKHQAQNCLLKILEEPPSRTVIILLTTNPYQLLWTIRSRARMLRFGEIPQRQIEEKLTAEGDFSPQAARMAAVFSHGSLAGAWAFDSEQYRQVREQALSFLSLLLKRGRFSETSAIAAGFAKDKKGLSILVESIETLLVDLYFARIAPARMSQPDLREDLDRLAQETTRSRVVSAIEAVKKLRRELRSNVNPQIALEALFLAGTEG